MKMKKLFLAIALTIGLVSCGNSSKKEEPWEPYVPTPIEPMTFKNYKVAVKFGEGQTIPDYVSSYVTGDFIDNIWKSSFKKGDDAPFKLKLDTTLGENVYSAVIPEIDPEIPIRYKVISIATANMKTPDANGEYAVGWSYESGDSSDESGDNNVVITPMDQNPIIKTLDVVNFPPEPADTTGDLTVNITLTDYNADTYAGYTWFGKGSWDWNTAYAATINGQTISFTIPDLAAGTYRFGLDSYNASGTWFKWFNTNGQDSYAVMGETDTTLNFTGTIASGNITPVE